MRKYASEIKLNWTQLLLMMKPVKGQSHKNTAAVTWRFSGRIPRLSNPYLSQERSSTIVWETYFWQPDLKGGKKKPQLFPRTHKRM